MPAVPKWSRLFAPDWLWGGDPREFFRNSALRVHRSAGDPVYLRVCTEERYTGSKARLLSERQLIGPGRPSMPLSDLSILAERVDDVDREASIGREDLLRQMSESVGEGSAAVHAITSAQLQTQLANADHLPIVVQSVSDGLRQAGVESDPTRKIFENSTVHLICRESALVHRMKMSSVWLRLGQDEALARGDITAITKANANGHLVFASAEGLSQGVVLLDAYLGPLLGALAPSVWAFTAFRAVGAILFTLGQPLAGTLGNPSELLQTITTPGADKGRRVPTLSATASPEAVRWWVNQLDDVLAVVSDPAVANDLAGIYSAPKHLQGVLTVEQLFRRVTSMLVSQRDTNARRVLLFTILDTLEGLTGRSIETHASLAFARKTLAHLRGVMPESAQELLLPSAQLAVEALEDLQNGFFLRCQTGAENIELHLKDGRVQVMNLDQAGGAYVKLLRDATHGHGAERRGRKAQINALIAHHNGKISHDLPLLGYLYLLDLLSRPEVLQRTLYRNGKT